MVHLLLAVIYLAFISLGLPDSLLGAAWPDMHLQMQVPVSYAGAVAALISLSTVASSLLSDRMNRRFGTGRVTAFSVLLSAVSLLGFSTCRHYPMLLLWAVPYGLGAGGVDAALNNYVALHYSSRHMSWLHCMWGVGCSIGPYILGYAMAGRGWTGGYLYIGILQVVISALIFFSLPLWKKNPGEEAGKQGKALKMAQILAIPGAKEVLLAFFCYCALEQTCCLWVSSYLNMHKGLDVETAARFASLFYMGITGGRALNGFLTMRFDDTTLIRMGQGVILLGVVVMVLPLGSVACLAGIVLIGVGCAPIYPCIIHSTPAHFGPENSQALVGVQMASAYLGNVLMPPLFGLIAQHITVALLPMYLLALLVCQVLLHERLLKKV